MNKTRVKNMIALDFDGVLHQYKGWNGGKLNDPMHGARQLVEEIIRQDGDSAHIAVFTARDKKVVEKWLRNYGFPPLMVTNEKLGMFTVYLDDKAMCFTPEMLNDIPMLARRLREFQPYWKK